MSGGGREEGTERGKRRRGKRTEIERDPEINLERNNKMERGRRGGGREREKKKREINGYGE